MGFTIFITKGSHTEMLPNLPSCPPYFPGFLVDIEGLTGRLTGVVDTVTQTRNNEIRVVLK